MRRTLPAVALLVVLLGAAAVAVWFVSAPAPERPSSVPPPAAPSEGVRAAAPRLAAAPATDGLRTRRFLPDEDHAPLPSTTGPPVPEALRRPDATPLESERLVEDKVIELLGLLDPSLDLTAVAHGCTDDGRHCTFEGPWVGDEYVQRWVQAISDGRTSLEALEGVRFSNLTSRQREDGARVFVLEAHAP